MHSHRAFEALAAELDPIELAIASRPLAEVLRRLAADDRATVPPPGRKLPRLSLAPGGTTR